jgi:hypothetical protein
MRISLKFLLLTFFATIFILTWGLPFLLILEGVQDPIRRSIEILVNETTATLQARLDADLQALAVEGFSVSNWTRQYGTPFSKSSKLSELVAKKFRALLGRSFHPSEKYHVKRLAVGWKYTTCLAVRHERQLSSFPNVYHKIAVE